MSILGVYFFSVGNLETLFSSLIWYAKGVGCLPAAATEPTHSRACALQQQKPVHCNDDPKAVKIKKIIIIKNF